ncbi:MAG: GTP-dependent dephospho-CoA kinase family protein [Candidatus Thermoplasmatota archaeon]|jgi:uncharacterized protein (UPF0218 family)|nr:GTP-dependent dephospho-CoA kinase family protein [Candidatus Thermoplasmatota archaeon]
MQLKSGSKFILSQEIIAEVSSYGHKMCNESEIQAFSRISKIISVGDVTTDTLHKCGVPVHLEVVDLKTRRGKEGEFQSDPSSHHVKNEAGTLSHDLFLLIRRLIPAGGRIEVNGEEDLAVIPIIYYCDLNTVIVYGIPGKGMACIAVDRSVKKNIEELVKRISHGRIEN